MQTYIAYIYVCMYVWMYVCIHLFIRGRLLCPPQARREDLMLDGRSSWHGGSDGVVMGHAGARAGGQSRPAGPGLADSPLMTVMEPCRS